MNKYLVKIAAASWADADAGLAAAYGSTHDPRYAELVNEYGKLRSYTNSSTGLVAGGAAGALVGKLAGKAIPFIGSSGTTVGGLIGSVAGVHLGHRMAFNKFVDMADRRYKDAQTSP